MLRPEAGLSLDQESQFNLRPGPSSQLWAASAQDSYSRCRAKRLSFNSRSYASAPTSSTAEGGPGPSQTPDRGHGPQQAGLLLPSPLRRESGPPAKPQVSALITLILFCNFNCIISDTKKPSLNFKPL